MDSVSDIADQKQSRSTTVLKCLLVAFGLVCIAIAFAHIVLGAAAIVGGVPVNATMDGEDRFFGTLFLGFGTGLIWSSRDLPNRRAVLGGLLLFFFLGGVSRSLSIVLAGWPHPLFRFLTAVELILPGLLWLGVRQATSHKQRSAR